MNCRLSGKISFCALAVNRTYYLGVLQFLSAILGRVTSFEIGFCGR